MERSIKKWLCLVLVLAGAARLFFVWSGKGLRADRGDQSEYLALAQNLHLHGSFSFGEPHKWGGGGHLNTAGPFIPTVARAPLYPMVIAALWWGKGPPMWGIRLLQILLSVATVFLAYLIASRAFGSRVGIMAAAGMALFPLSVYLTVEILSETLFTFLITLGIWFWSGRHPYPAGAALGLAALTRPNLLPFIILLGLYALISKGHRAVLGKLVLVALLVIAPWTIRNYIVAQKFVPIQTSGWGCHLLFGTLNLPGELADIGKFIRSNPTVVRIIETTDSETEAEQAMMKVALERIKKNPFKWAINRIIQSYRFFIDQGIYLQKNNRFPLPPVIIKTFFVIGSILFWLLALCGIIKERKQWKRLEYLILLPAFFIVAQIPMLAYVRYSLPLIPLVMVFAAKMFSDLIATAGTKLAGKDKRA